MMSMVMMMAMMSGHDVHGDGSGRDGHDVHGDDDDDVHGGHDDCDGDKG